MDRDLASMLFLVVGISLVAAVSATHRLESKTCQVATEPPKSRPQSVAVVVPQAKNVGAPVVATLAEVPAAVHPVIEAKPVANPRVAELISRPVPVSAPGLTRSAPAGRASAPARVASRSAKTAPGPKAPKGKNPLSLALTSLENLSTDLGVHHSSLGDASRGFGATWSLRDPSVPVGEPASVGFGRSNSQVPEIVFQGATNRSFVWRWQSPRDLSWPAADSARRAYLRVKSGVVAGGASDSVRSGPRVSDQSDSAFMAGLRSGSPVAEWGGATAGNPEMGSIELPGDPSVASETQAVAKGWGH